MFSPEEASIIPVKVVTPAILTLSKFVWPSTSKSPFKSTLPSIVTLSKFVSPSTSKFPFASMLPENVETPVTFNCWISAVPNIVTPYPVVANFNPSVDWFTGALKYNLTASPSSIKIPVLSFFACNAIFPPLDAPVFNLTKRFLAEESI